MYLSVFKASTNFWLHLTHFSHTWEFQICECAFPIVVVFCADWIMFDYLFILFFQKLIPPFNGHFLFTFSCDFSTLFHSNCPLCNAMASSHIEFSVFLLYCKKQKKIWNNRVKVQLDFRAFYIPHSYEKLKRSKLNTWR